MLRATRKGVRRESLAVYALLQRADGSPAWVFTNSFDMVAKMVSGRRSLPHDSRPSLRMAH